MTASNHARITSRSLALFAVPLMLLTLAACSRGADPYETLEGLDAVIEEPDADPAVDEYDAEQNPDPIVEPLECTPYLVITARGTGEPSNGQLLSPIVRNIAEARPDQMGILDLDYPADGDIGAGGTLAARLLVDTLNVQTETCEDQRFILLGYSQGALVIGDALAAPDTRLVGMTVGELSPQAAERILAVVLYGNPRFVASEPYNIGTFDPSLDGIIAREPGDLAPFADRLRDYCVLGDFICQSTYVLDDDGHSQYYSNGMQLDGAAFVIMQLDDEWIEPEEPEDEGDPEEDGGIEEEEQPPGSPGLLR